jgi:hypothetical protein
MLHFLGIAGYDHGQVAFAVGHFFDQYLNHLAAEILGIVVGAGQRVGFVDEEHAAAGFFDGFFDFGSRLADVFADEVDAVHFVDMAFGKEAHFLVEAAHHLGHGGFAGARVADENGMDVDFLFFVEPFLPAQLQEFDVVGVVAHLFFDLVQPDQQVQFADHLFEGQALKSSSAGNSRGAFLVGQIDRHGAFFKEIGLRRE